MGTVVECTRPLIAMTYTSAAFTLGPYIQGSGGEEPVNATGKSYRREMESIREDGNTLCCALSVSLIVLGTDLMSRKYCD